MCVPFSLLSYPSTCYKPSTPRPRAKRRPLFPASGYTQLPSLYVLPPFCRLPTACGSWLHPDCQHMYLAGSSLRNLWCSELPRVQGLSVRVLLKHLLCYDPRVGCSLQVVAAGFTIAPLQPRFTGGGASGECLVTLVLKLDDLGGWLSGARLGGLLLPWMRSILAGAAAGAVIALRDKA